MTFVYDETWTPKPDTHGVVSHPIDSTGLVSPFGDQHDDGMGYVYPQDQSGVVHPMTDDHCNDQFVLHRGEAKPGSFKDQQTPRPKQPPVL